MTPAPNTGEGLELGNVARAIWNTPQDSPRETYALRMRLSWDEAKRAASNVLTLTRPSPMVSSDGLIERLRKRAEWRNEKLQCAADPAMLIEAADALEANKRALSDAEIVLREARQWVEHYNLQHRTLGTVTDVLARIDTALEAMST